VRLLMKTVPMDMVAPSSAMYMAIVYSNQGAVRHIGKSTVGTRPLRAFWHSDQVSQCAGQRGVRQQAPLHRGILGLDGWLSQGWADSSLKCNTLGCVFRVPWTSSSAPATRCSAPQSVSLF